MLVQDYEATRELFVAGARESEAELYCVFASVRIPPAVGSVVPPRVHQSFNISKPDLDSEPDRTLLGAVAIYDVVVPARSGNCYFQAILEGFP
ncbi:hypothetical protein GCM10009554_46300 [Kribbella koreensis]|uniref:OTU domain-containing protein n=1 Tax=Kribbella koreensis TaxID=57909 RepID=A0ABP4BEG4_9ACTN